MDEITYVTRAEAAQLLDRDVRTIDRYRKTIGHGGKPVLTTYGRPGAGGVYLDKAEVERLRRPVPVGAAGGAN